MSDLAPILVATDFSPGAEEACKLAQRLAAALDSDVILAHVLADPTLVGPLDTEPLREIYESARTWASGMLDKWAEEARGRGVRMRVVVRTGEPHEQLVALAAEEHAGLVVMGTHGRGRIDRMLLGSVADRVRRLAPCPVLTVRESS